MPPIALAIPLPNLPQIPNLPDMGNVPEINKAALPPVNNDAQQVVQEKENGFSKLLSRHYEERSDNAPVKDRTKFKDKTNDNDAGVAPKAKVAQPESKEGNKAHLKAKDPASKDIQKSDESENVLVSGEQEDRSDSDVAANPFEELFNILIQLQELVKQPAAIASETANSEGAAQVTVGQSLKEVLSAMRELMQTLQQLANQKNINVAQGQVQEMKGQETNVPLQAVAVLSATNPAFAKAMQALQNMQDTATQVGDTQVAQIATSLQEQLGKIQEITPEPVRDMIAKIAELTDAAIPQLNVKEMPKVKAAMQSQPMPQIPQAEDIIKAVAEKVSAPLNAPAPVAQQPVVDTSVQPLQAAKAIQADNSIAPVFTINAVAKSFESHEQSSNSEQGAGQNNSAGTAGVVQAPSANSTQNIAKSQDFSKLVEGDIKSLPEQITFHMKAASLQGATRVSIQLDPIELGKLDIQMHVSASGKVNVSITAENRQALELLQRDMGALSNALSDAGFKTDGNSLSFNLRGGDSQQHASHQSNQQSHQQAYRQQGALAEESDGIEEALLHATTSNYILQMRDGLDIKV